jgi:flagellar biosynthesis GTPase FlhF
MDNGAVVVVQDKAIGKRQVVLSEKVVKSINMVLADAAEIKEVSSDKDVDDADEVIIQMKDLEKEVNARRLDATRPIDKLKKEIKAAADEYTNKLNDSRKELSKKVADYVRAERLRVERERAEYEAAARRAAEREPEQIADFDDIEDEPAPVIAPLSATSSIVKTRKIKKLVIDDPHSIPRFIQHPDGQRCYLLKPCESTIKTAILDWKVSVPGCRIVEEEITVN